jgi:hypothetical protein
MPIHFVMCSWNHRYANYVEASAAAFGTKWLGVICETHFASH